MSDLMALAVFAALVFAAAMFGGQWGANEWYARLAKPGFTPPNWLFPVAWLFLYIAIAFAGWLVWLAPESQARTVSLVLWAGQLLINAGWSYVFFGRRELGRALIGIGAMWLLILAFIATAWAVDERASFLFMPYAVWVSYAALLNYVILRMNPAHR